MFKIYILLLLAFLVVYIIFVKIKSEGFSSEFNKTQTSSQFLQTVNMGDHKTIVQSQKGDNSKTVILLHDTPLCLNLWMPLFQTMQRMNMNGTKTPNLVAYDLRGHGSAWMPVDSKYNDANVDNAAWTLDQFVQDCKKIYDTVVGGGKVTVCGFGLGGIIAQKFALTYPKLIDMLVILQTTISPLPHLREDASYLSNWIAKNPSVWHLTSESSFVKKILCEWFNLPNGNCPDSARAKFNDENAPQYNMTLKMWQEGSSTTTLQATKLLLSTDLAKEWREAKKLPFMVHILTATNDPAAPPDEMTRSYTDIYNTNRELVVALDIVQGKHGFTIMRPDYIAKIICKECR